MPSQPSSGLLSYGRARSGAPLASPRPDKYLAFDADMGGFNNILMNFEIMVVLAALTGRTLVLPPPRPFYLLGAAPRLLTDFFDRQALARFIEVLGAEGLRQCLGWPLEAAGSKAFHGISAESVTTRVGTPCRTPVCIRLTQQLAGMS